MTGDDEERRCNPPVDPRIDDIDSKWVGEGVAKQPRKLVNLLLIYRHRHGRGYGR